MTFEKWINFPLTDEEIQTAIEMLKDAQERRAEERRREQIELVKESLRGVWTNNPNARFTIHYEYEEREVYFEDLLNDGLTEIKLT